MTPSQKSALAIFNAAKNPLVPQYAEIRKDVARALFDGGYVECFKKNDSFRGGYAPLIITEKGRAAAPSLPRQDRGSV